MFGLTENSIHALLEASQQLHGKMISSPLWEMLKDDPIIVQWMNALNEVESQIKRKEQPDGAKAKG